MLDWLIDAFGDHGALGLGGVGIGLLFGAAAQRSRFCLRSATLEVAHGELGERLAIWLFVFSTALIATQALIRYDLFDTGTVRQLNNQGSMSGSIVGGLLFGGGMTLTRACGSRMLVLSATGNLRALASCSRWSPRCLVTGCYPPCARRSAISGQWIVPRATFL